MLSMKKSEKSVNSIIKFYPSLGNNLRNKVLSSNENLAIFSYSKQPKTLENTFSHNNNITT